MRGSRIRLCIPASSPGVNLTSGNSNLAGTDWSKFETSNPTSGILRIPGSTPINPSEVKNGSCAGYGLCFGPNDLCGGASGVI